MLDAKAIIEDTEDLKRYNRDWTGKYCGAARLVLCPSSVAQVQAILRYCNERRLAVVPQGGNTGLVGGSVPVFDELILSLERLNRIRAFEALSGVVTTEAGCILQRVDEYVRERGHVMPLDLGAKGSCQIGGCVATNAGGLRLLRYGSLHGNVLGLQIVLADGTLLEGRGSCRKDNTGYDYKQLFIGSEGTLGVVTAASLLTPPKPSSVNVALLTVPTYDDIIKIFVKAKRNLGEVLSAFEFWDLGAQRLLEAHFSASQSPLQMQSGFAVLIETSGSNAEHDTAKLMAFLEDVQHEALATDGTIAQDETQLKDLWALREGIPEACSKKGIVLKYDVSLPTPTQMYEPVLALTRRLADLGAVRCIVGYGHFGDGNIHINIALTRLDDESVSLIEPFIYDFIRTGKASLAPPSSTGCRGSEWID